MTLEEFAAKYAEPRHLTGNLLALAANYPACECGQIPYDYPYEPPRESWRTMEAQTEWTYSMGCYCGRTADGAAPTREAAYGLPWPHPKSFNVFNVKH